MVRLYLSVAFAVVLTVPGTAKRVYPVNWSFDVAARSYPKLLCNQRYYIDCNALRPECSTLVDLPFAQLRVDLQGKVVSFNPFTTPLPVTVDSSTIYEQRFDGNIRLNTGKAFMVLNFSFPDDPTSKITFSFTHDQDASSRQTLFGDRTPLK